MLTDLWFHLDIETWDIYLCYGRFIPWKFEVTYVDYVLFFLNWSANDINLFNPTGHVMHQQFNLLNPTGHVMHQQFNLLKPTGYVMYQQLTF